MCFFAFIDPKKLEEGPWPPLALSSWPALPQFNRRSFGYLQKHQRDKPSTHKKGDKNSSRDSGEDTTLFFPYFAVLQHSFSFVPLCYFHLWPYYGNACVIWPFGYLLAWLFDCSSIETKSSFKREKLFFQTWSGITHFSSLCILSWVISRRFSPTKEREWLFTSREKVRRTSQRLSGEKSKTFWSTMPLSFKNRKKHIERVVNQGDCLFLWAYLHFACSFH